MYHSTRPQQASNNFQELLNFCKRNSTGDSSQPGGHIQPDAETEELIRKMKCVLANNEDIFQKVNGKMFLHFLLRRQSKKLTATQFHLIAVALVSFNCCEIFNIKDDSDGYTPLQLAVQNMELLPVTLFPLYFNEVNFSTQNKQEDSLLMSALSGGRSTELVSQLVEKCKANWMLKNLKGENVIHYACKNDAVSSNTLDYLLRLGDVLFFNQSDINGNTPLHVCVRACARDLSPSCIPNARKLELLLQFGFGTRANMRNREGCTPMDILNGVELSQAKVEEAYWLKVLKQVLKGDRLNCVLETETNQSSQH